MTEAMRTSGYHRYHCAFRSCSRTVRSTLTQAVLFPAIGFCDDVVTSRLGAWGVVDPWRSFLGVARRSLCAPGNARSTHLREILLEMSFLGFLLMLAGFTVLLFFVRFLWSGIQGTLATLRVYRKTRNPRSKRLAKVLPLRKKADGSRVE